MDTDFSQDRTIDVRKIPPRMRHALIFKAFQAAAAGEAIELINDHDPVPLYYQFTAQFSAQFDWEYLQHGPALWHVKITKRSTGARDSLLNTSTG